MVKYQAMQEKFLRDWRRLRKEAQAGQVDKVRVIQLSIRCRRLGLVSLIPVFGMPFVYLAILAARRAEQAAGNQWNPAETRVKWGRRLAYTGFLLTLLACLLVIRLWINDFVGLFL